VCSSDLPGKLFAQGTAEGLHIVAESGVQAHPCLEGNAHDIEKIRDFAADSLLAPLRQTADDPDRQHIAAKDTTYQNNRPHRQPQEEVQKSKNSSQYCTHDFSSLESVNR